MEAPKNTTCPHCKLPLREYHDFTTCPTCRTSYHEKCWQECEGCTSCTATAGKKNTLDKSLSWYLFHGNKNLGPLTWEELCGHPGIQPGDLVWNSRLPDWVRADQIPQLPLKRSQEKPGAEPAKKAKAGKMTPPHAAGEHEGGALTGEEHPGEEPFSEDEVPQWKLGEAVKISERDGELPDDDGGALAAKPSPTEQSPEEPSRAEQILDRLYAGEVPGPPPDTDFLDRKEEYDDKKAGAGRRHTRHIIFGILLALGGTVTAIAATHIATSKEIFYYIAAGWAVVVGIIDFSWGVWGRLKQRAPEQS